MSELVTRADAIRRDNDEALLQKCKQDPFPSTVHWVVSHRSHHLTEEHLKHLLSINTPIKGQARCCQNCGWPGSIASLCMLCCEMAEVLFDKAGLMQAHEDWAVQRRMRQLGLL